MQEALDQFLRAGDVKVFADDFVAWRAQRDRFDNDVTLLRLPVHDRDFRMVHHSRFGVPLQKATIYSGRGKFTRYSAYSSEANPCATEWVKVGGYEAEWGDGDLLRLQQASNGPVIPADVVRSLDANFMAFTLMAVAAIHIANLWEVREVSPP